MRRKWVKRGWMGGALLAALGLCYATANLQKAAAADWWGQFSLTKLFKKDPELKPPSHPEELTSPPADDPRFSKPISFPKETLNQDSLRKKMKDKKDGPGGAPGGMGGMGGMGRGY